MSCQVKNLKTGPWTRVHESGELTLVQGLMRSCNPWFTILDWIFQTNGATIFHIARGFGLGSATGMNGR